MKKFEINVHYDVAISVSVYAETEEAAKDIAVKKAAEITLADGDCNFTDACVTDTSDLSFSQDLKNVIDLIRQRIPLEDVQVTTSHIFNEHSSLADCDPLNLTDRITDLLEEYGDDHDLPEGWYLNEIDDIEDVLQMY